MVSSKYSHDPSINFTPQKYCFFWTYANNCIKKCRNHRKMRLEEIKICESMKDDWLGRD